MLKTKKEWNVAGRPTLGQQPTRTASDTPDGQSTPGCCKKLMQTGGVGKFRPSGRRNCSTVEIWNHRKLQCSATAPDHLRPFLWTTNHNTDGCFNECDVLLEKNKTKEMMQRIILFPRVSEFGSGVRWNKWATCSFSCSPLISCLPHSSWIISL